MFQERRRATLAKAVVVVRAVVRAEPEVLGGVVVQPCGVVHLKQGGAEALHGGGQLLKLPSNVDMTFALRVQLAEVQNWGTWGPRLIRDCSVQRVVPSAGLRAISCWVDGACCVSYEIYPRYFQRAHLGTAQSAAAGGREMGRRRRRTGVPSSGAAVRDWGNQLIVRDVPRLGTESTGGTSDALAEVGQASCISRSCNGY